MHMHPPNPNPGASQPYGLDAETMEGCVGDEGWGELNKTEWNGLGITDPIKKVEVGRSKPCSVRLFTGLRTSGCYSQHF